MIQTNQLRKCFGAIHAVNDVSFQAHDGAITTLLGANGSGKSTTLRLLSGLLRPDAGSAQIDHIVVADDPLAARARLGVFPDQFGLYPRLTAREHLEYYAGFHGLRGAALAKSVEHISEELEMNGILNRRTEGFSQGQRMKVALARTLIHQPHNLILDEPTRGLDVSSMRLLRRVLRALRSAGRCILLSSHAMAEVEELSDEIVMIDEGKVMRRGAPGALIEQAGAPNLEEAFIHFTAPAGAQDLPC